MGLYLGSSKIKWYQGANLSHLSFFTSRPLPTLYQEVDWICAAANVQAYIDLGFAFDTKATIKMTQWIENLGSSTYPFGAVENSGTLRCCFSCPYSSESTFYGSNGTGYIGAIVDINAAKSSFVINIAPGNLTVVNNENNTTVTLKTQGEYTMTNNLYLFAQNYNGTARFGGVRKIGQFQYYNKDDELICDLVPCYRKTDGVIGMYDRARRTFFENIGTGSFTKGNDTGFITSYGLLQSSDGYTLLDSNGVYLKLKEDE